MKYCPNCGNPLAEEAVFCPSCGQRAVKEQAAPEQAVPEQAAPEQVVPEQAAPEQAAPVSQEAPAKKRRPKVGLIIALAAVAALLIAAAVLYFTGAFTKVLPPSRAKVALAEKQLVDDGLDMYFASQKSVKDLDLDLNITAELDAQSSGLFSEIGMIKSILDKVSLDLKLDGQNMGVGVNYSGNSVLEGRVIATDDGFGLYVPQLDGKYYTISREALTKLISNDETALSADVFDMTGLDEAKTRKEIYDILQILAKVSTDDNTVIEKGVSFPLFDGEKTVTADRYTITPDKETLSAVIKELGEYLSREDCYLGSKLAAVISSSEVDPEDPFAELINNSDKLAQDVIDVNTKVVIAMVGDEIVSQSVLTDDGKFVLDTEKGKDDSHRAFAAVDSEGKREMTANAVFETFNDKATKGVVDITADDQQMKLDIDISKPSSKPLDTSGSVKVTMDGKELALITFTPEAGKNNISVDLKIDDPDSEISGVKLSMVASDGTGVDAPKDVSPTDVSDWTPEQIEEIFENMGEQLGSVISDILF